MINLEKTSGLPIELTDDFHLKFNTPMKEFPLSIVRTFDAMLPVLMDPKIEPPRQELYYVYRGIYKPDDEATVKTERLTYDITILPPLMLGNEFNKVFGHYHVNIPGLPVSHPELYEVLNGTGIFYMQKMDAEFVNLISVLVCEVGAGDKIIFPPNYGHGFINTGKEPMVTANWSSLDENASYDQVKEKHGMAYYAVKDEKGQVNFVKNMNYGEHPTIRKIIVADKIRTEFGFDTKEPMYQAAMKDPKLLEFLSNPVKYAVALSTITS